MYKKMELKADSIQFVGAFDDIGKLEAEIRYKLRYMPYYLFDEIGFDSTMVYLDKFKKLIDGQLKNSYLLSDDSLYIQWRGMYDWIYWYVNMTNNPLDDIGWGKGFRQPVFQKAMEEQFGTKYRDFMNFTKRKLKKKLQYNL